MHQPPGDPVVPPAGVTARDPDPGVPLPPAPPVSVPMPPAAVPLLTPPPGWTAPRGWPVTSAPASTASTGWLQAAWQPGRLVPPAAGGHKVARLAAVGVVGVTVLLAIAIAALRIAGTYPSTLDEIDVPGAGPGSFLVLWLVVVMLALTVGAAQHYLDGARRRAGSDGIGPFLDSGTEAAEASGWHSSAQAGPLSIRPMRRTVIVALAVAIVGVFILAAGQVVLWFAASASAIRAGAWLAIGGSIALIAAAALLPVVFRGTDRRLTEASRTRDGGQVMDPGRRSVVVAPLLAIGILGSAALAFGISVADAEPAVCDVGPGWSCGIVRVPADRDTASSGLVEIAYTIHPATARPPGAARRVLVLAVGGPGVAGLPEADWMHGSLDPRVQAQFDVVVYDPRSTGQSEFRDCPEAATAYYADDRLPTAPSARTFADRCIAESGADADHLERYGSRGVAEDIDALRDVLGVERISLYGVSYGTVVAQAYAEAHPDRLDALVLDAPVDRSLPPAESWAVSAAGFESALEDTFAACRADSSCHDDLPDPERAWSRLLDATERRPLEAQLFDDQGSAFRVTVPRSGLINLMQGAMYDITDRMSFLRALAAYDRKDPRGFARLWDAWSGTSADSSFAYFATWCADGRHSPTPESDDFDAFVRVASRAGIRDPGSLAVAYSTAPCLYWPSQPDRWEAPNEATTVPTLILAATSDPITPVSEARSILGRHPEARLVETRGGAHGSLGDDCPTDRMTRFLVDGTLPSARTSTCVGSIIDVYIPIAPLPATTADDVVSGVYRELFGDPLVLSWSGDEPLTFGCAIGGTATFAPVDDEWRSAVSLDRCMWVPGAQLSGSGTLELSGWGAELELTSARGDLRLDGDYDHWRLTGTWDGKPVAVDE